LSLDVLAIILIIVTCLSPLAAFVAISLAGWFGLAESGLRRLAVAASVGAATIAAGGSGWLLWLAIIGLQTQAGFKWASFGNRAVELSLRLDPLSASLSALIATVALLVTIYSLGYMRDDARYARYFACLSFFSGAMLVLVWSGSLLLLYMAWELVGLASYLLIGYYWERPEAGPAATKAFLITRIGDVGLLLAIAALFLQTGTFDIIRNLEAVATGQISGPLLTVIALLLFMGAAGKSAQLPFQVWLPDAMAGPTPVSALIHSATMVAAGVYLVARMLPLIMAAGVAAGVVVAIGLATTLLASCAALAQTELKRVLAYSTISQLGEMLVGLGLGGLFAGTYHLLIQGLFKAALFLAAGNLAHALGSTGRVEFARYGGQGRRLPFTRLGFLIAGLALAGIPITLAPSSRDPILSLALTRQPLIAGLLVVADFLTAAYIARAFLLAFTEAGSRQAKTIQAEATLSPPPKLKETKIMVGPLLVLVGLVVVVAPFGSLWLGQPFKAFIEPTPSGVLALPIEYGMEELTLILSLGAALAGLAAAWYFVGLSRPTPTQAQPYKVSPLYNWVESGFGFDTLYTKGLEQVALSLMQAANWFERIVLNAVADRLAVAVLLGAQVIRNFDTKILDRAADQLADLTLGLARRQSDFDKQVVDQAAEGLAIGVGRSSRPLSRLQTGQVGNYLLAIFVWSMLALAVSLILSFWS